MDRIQCDTGSGVVKDPKEYSSRSQKIIRKKILRPRSRGQLLLDLSPNEGKDVNPKLSALLLTLFLLVFVAVGSTVVVAARYHGNDTTSTESANGFQDMLGGRSFDVLLGNWKYDHYHRILSHHHHSPLFPLQSSDYIGFVLATIGLMIAAGGGIGGGGLLVPIFCLVHGFSAKHAIPLSNITVLGGAVANTVLNTRKRHPLADRPLVDWDLILVMEPLTIAGALIGAFLNKVLPESVLTVMLVVLLSFTAYTSLNKAVKMYKIESIHMREQGIRENGTKESELTRLAHDEEDKELVNASEGLLDDPEYQDNDDIVEDEESNYRALDGIDGRSAGEDGMPEVEALETEASRKEQLERILEEEKIVPMTNIYLLVAMFVVVLAINILKGGGAFPSPIGIQCGSPSFWIANGIMIGWIFMITFFVRAYLLNRYRTKQRVGYPYVEGDIKWDPRATIVYPSICALAGFFAGMFGVGVLTFFIYICLVDLSNSIQYPVTYLLADLPCCHFHICRWRDCQRTAHARHGGSPRSQFGVFSMHDFIYQFYSHNILRGFWFVGG